MFAWLLIFGAVALLAALLRWYRRTDPGSVYDEAAHAYVARVRMRRPGDH